MTTKRSSVRASTGLANSGGITVTLATGVIVFLSAGVATAYASTSSPIAQIRILRDALANGTAVPLHNVKSLIDEVQTAYEDVHPRKKYYRAKAKKPNPKEEGPKDRK